jgi:DNA-binding CsgD family transcriptional regulator/tetratricopeptide (TPR) repeat protein
MRYPPSSVPDYTCPVEANAQMISDSIRCLFQKGGEYLLVAQTVAILGRDSNAELVAGLSNTEIDTVRTVLDWLTRVQLLNRHGVPQQQVAPYLLRSLPLDLQSSMHSRAALLLRNADASAIAVSGHLIKIRGVQFPWAAAVLCQAANELLAADQVKSAIHCFQSAYRCASSEDDRAEIAAQLVLVEWRINPSTATRNFRRMLAAVDSQKLPGRLSIPIAHYLLWHGRAGDAQAALAPIFTGSPTRESVGHDRVRFHDKFIEYMFPGFAEGMRFPRSVPDHPSARGSLEDLPATEATGLISDIVDDCRDSEIAQRAHQLLSRYRLDSSSVFPLMLAVEGLLYVDKFAAASSWCDALCAEAMARRSPTWQAMFSGLRANISLLLGDLPKASEEAKRALSYLQSERAGVVAAATVSTLISALTAAGRIDEAQVQLERRVHGSLYETRYALPYLRARGHLLLNSDRPVEALHEFQRCGTLMQVWKMDIPGLVAWRNDVAQAFLALGDLNSARLQAQSHIDRIGGATAHSTGCESLRVIAATLDPVNRIPVLRQAAAIARRTHRRFELGTVFRDLCFAYEGVGDRKRSRSLRQCAGQLAVECGSGALLQQLSYEAVFDQPLAAPPLCLGHDDTIRLTPAEHRVARMAAQGSTNREIAKELGITMSTVEQHLTHVFKKLYITRRTELRFLVPQNPLQTIDSEIHADRRMTGLAPASSL